jgi:hypothetical protein
MKEEAVLVVDHGRQGTVADPGRAVGQPTQSGGSHSACDWLVRPIRGQPLVLRHFAEPMRACQKDGRWQTCGLGSGFRTLKPAHVGDKRLQTRPVTSLRRTLGKRTTFPFGLLHSPMAPIAWKEEYGPTV